MKALMSPRVREMILRNHRIPLNNGATFTYQGKQYTVQYVPRPR